MSSDGGDAGGREGQEEAEEGSQSSELIFEERFFELHRGRKGLERSESRSDAFAIRLELTAS